MTETFTTTPADTDTNKLHNAAKPLVTKGAGKAVHLGATGHMGLFVTLCDGWGAHGARSSAVRLARYAEAVTCKSCIRNA